MKKTKLKISDSEMTGIDSFPWRSILEIINWKLNKRHKEGLGIRISLNYSIIIDLTATIEGFLNETFDNIVSRRISMNSEEFETYPNKLDSIDEFKIRLIEFIGEKINGSTWKEYNAIFKVLVNKEIKGNINNELWKGISSLFTFRNMIVHGKILSIDYHQIDDSSEYRIEVKNKYKSVYNYLSEKKLIEVDKFGFVSMINDRIIDHYFHLSKNFMVEVVNQIPDKNERAYIKLILDDLVKFEEPADNNK